MVPILVVDLDKERLAATAAMLSRHGYCPLTARFEREALALLSQMPIELALVECAPSSADHAGLIGSIREQHPRVAVVAMIDGGVSSRTPTPSMLDALGVSGIVRSPCLAAPLLTAVGRCLLDTLAA
jgi:DNA-binding NtrC family response regulator